jgi:hypothetical protein
MNRQCVSASSEAQNKGEAKCEIAQATDMHEAVTAGSDAVVSPAISLAISPANGREQLTTETEGNKSSNQSGSKSVEKPNCYKCKYRSELVYSAHSECKHPLAIYEARAQILGGTLLNVSGSPYGIRNGWFRYPFNFDPTWLKSCNGFEPVSSPLPSNNVDAIV